MGSPTPGPWEAVFRDDERELPQMMYVGLVADISDSIKVRAASVVTDGRVSWEAEWAANARLIAAAPDLLAVTRELLEDHCRIEPHHEDVCALCKRARAAISKAEGSP